MKRKSVIVLSVSLTLTGAGLLVRDWLVNRASEDVRVEKDAWPSQQSTRPAPDRESPVPALVALLSDPSVHQARQIEAIRSLPDDLTIGEFRDLVAVIKGPAPEFQDRGQWTVLINEMMGVLRKPRLGIPAYQEVMVAMVVDQDLDPLVRDYAAQHLSVSLGELPTGSSGAEFRLSMEALIGVLNRTDQSFDGSTGTILMSLTNLSDELPENAFEPYRERLGKIIVPMISGERKVGFSNRISAIQAAGRMGFGEALPAIRRIASDESEKPSFRLSAVAALGYFARPEDREFIARLATGDSVVVPAAVTALKSFTK